MRFCYNVKSQSKPIAEGDAEILVLGVVRIVGLIDLCQTEIVAGIQNDVLIFIQETQRNAKVNGFANLTAYQPRSVPLQKSSATTSSLLKTISFS